MLIRGLKLNKSTSILALFTLPVALILLSDNILSFIVPIEIGKVVNSNLLTGVILGFSSLVGLFSDYLFPPFLKNLSWKVQFIAAVIMALFFPIISALGIIYSSIWLFFMVSILWGIYYELLVFSEEDFMVEEETKREYSKDWSVLMSLNVFTNIIGPIIASVLVILPVWNFTTILVFIVIIALIYSLTIFGFQIKHPESTDENSVKEITKRHRFRGELFREMKLWKEFLKEMLPILILTFFLNWLDMTFFVLGGLFGIKLVGTNGLEWIVVVLYNLPTILIAIFLVKKPIERKKKLYSTVALLFAGIAFSLVAFFSNLGLLVLLPIVTGAFAIAFSWPLSKAAVSDITRRAGIYKTNVMGIYNAISSLACFISPIVMGYIADSYGYYIMITIMGVISIVVAILLLVIMPKRINVKHLELEKIDAALKI